MFEKLKRFGRNFTQTTPFILSNTIILIPYLLFLGITDSHNWLTILPFTLFYAFRMTGLFLVNSLRFGLDSYTLLMIALLMGGTGSLLGILGVFYFPLFYFSSVLLGLSAAWLVPANITVNFHEKTQGFINMTEKILICSYLAIYPVSSDRTACTDSDCSKLYDLYTFLRHGLPYGQSLSALRTGFQRY